MRPTVSPKRQGAARTRRLSPAQREFYFWILVAFAAATPQGGEQTRVAADGFGLDPAEALAVLAREHLVHADASAAGVLRTSTLRRPGAQLGCTDSRPR